MLTPRSTCASACSRKRSTASLAASRSKARCRSRSSFVISHAISNTPPRYSQFTRGPPSAAANASTKPPAKQAAIQSSCPSGFPGGRN